MNIELYVYVIYENIYSIIFIIGMGIVFLIIGLLLILVGANALTDGAASVAKRLKVSGLVIGLTIVAFGTSTPEFTISVISAFKGSADIAIGNVVGSNLFNTLVIVGSTALVLPITVGKNTIRKEIPLCILASIILWICSNEVLLDGAASNVIDRSDGMLLLCFFAIFLGYTFAIARDGGIAGEGEIKLLPVWKSVLFIIIGLLALIGGGQLFVNGATAVARSLGVSESIIGLTLVAGGTSLPELAISIVAALKKNPEMAIGNAIGSNLFNIFLVLGCSASIFPLKLGDITNLDLIVLILSSLLLWLFAILFKKRTITRWEGAIMILCYIGYTIYLIMQQ